MNTPTLKVKTYSIDEMLAKDGRYVITNAVGIRRGLYAVCEVESGVCYQLDKQEKRDGELSRDGWSPGVILVAAEDAEKLLGPL